MSGVANLHTLWSYGAGLCIRCKGCDKRAVIAPEKFERCQGDMTRVRDLKLVCATCGARDFETTVPPSEAAAQRFLEGTDIRSACTV